ncbi:MAG: hypothetical protein COA42_14500 [Alteromonadaceae bacterium]|nr:MAG: hypothetical protein COA42_14500 [Alteromonadaceae bacterium]
MKYALILFLIYSIESKADESGGCDAGGAHEYSVNCLSAKYTSAKTNLTKAYKGTIERAREEDAWNEKNGRTSNFLELTKKSQRAWKEYVNSYCELYGSTLASSSWGGVRMDECRINHFERRVYELNGILGG